MAGAAKEFAVMLPAGDWSVQETKEPECDYECLAVLHHLSHVEQEHGFHHDQQEHGFPHHSFLQDFGPVHMKTRAVMNMHEVLFDISPYLHATGHSNLEALRSILPPSANATFLSDYEYDRRLQQMMVPTVPLGTHKFGSQFMSPPIAPRSNFAEVRAGQVLMQRELDRAIETLRRKLDFKCPGLSELLMAITTSVKAAVRKHGPSVSSSDEYTAPDQDILRAAITAHPFYPELVLAHVRILKIGAPKGLRAKLDNVMQKFQSFQSTERANAGDDPDLDYFMRSYINLLSRFRQNVEDPFYNSMADKEDMTGQLEEMCSYPVNTTPDESNDSGFDIHQGADGMHTQELRKKFGPRNRGLKAGFLRACVKSGKLPREAVITLKDWFALNAKWPYPTDSEKMMLQGVTSLTIKQISNWFMNERKRHWSGKGHVPQRRSHQHRYQL